MKAEALYFEKRGAIKIRDEELPAPGKDEVLIRTGFSAISSGTEMLVYRGLMPENTRTDVTITSLSGTMKYPLKYGYSTVGQVMSTGREVDPSWIGKRVFVFHPHQNHFLAEKDELIEIPPHLDDLDALFLPAMETAVSLVMDGMPMLDEDIIIFGQGVIGLLTTAVLSSFPLNSLVTVDPFDRRREVSRQLGATNAVDPQELQPLLSGAFFRNTGEKSDTSDSGADLVFELSGNPETLNSAINSVGYDGRLVIGSWYGKKHSEIHLGERFHRSHMKIISSQVSRIPPHLRGRWNKERRFMLVWKLLGSIRPSKLITHTFDFFNAENAYRLLNDNPQEALQVILRY